MTGKDLKERSEKRRPKSDKVDLDEIDLKILEILEADARVSYSTLSEKVGLSRVSVKERVSELKRLGVIERFTIQVPAKHMGRPLPVFFDLRISPELLEQAALEIASHPDIVIVYQMSGVNALHVHGFFKDVDAVTSFINLFLSKIAGIQNVSSEFLFKRFKSDRMLLV